jgi:hypothetical protein
MKESGSYVEISRRGARGSGGGGGGGRRKEQGNVSQGGRGGGGEADIELLHRVIVEEVFLALYLVLSLVIFSSYYSQI